MTIIIGVVILIHPYFEDEVTGDFAGFQQESPMTKRLLFSIVLMCALVMTAVYFVPDIVVSPPFDLLVAVAVPVLAEPVSAFNAVIAVAVAVMVGVTIVMLALNLGRHSTAESTVNRNIAMTHPSPGGVDQTHRHCRRPDRVYFGGLGDGIDDVPAGLGAFARRRGNLTGGAMTIRNRDPT